jgi:hypothetical protein
MTATKAHEGYSFSEKLLEGQRGELFMASCLSRYGRVQLVTDTQMQRVGVDAFLVSPALGYITLQLKRCTKAATTGNAFIELYICDEEKQVTDRGWALKTIANNVVYWAAGTSKLYVLDTMKMKRSLSRWRHEHREGYGCSIERGRKWYGKGLLVPLKMIEREVATSVLEIVEP